MKIIYNDSFLKFFRIGGITLYPFIFLRNKYKNNKKILNHEKIHIEQQKELLIIGFYIWYLLEWIVRIFMKGNAYKNIRFEKEAYSNADNLDYLKTRKKYNWI